MRPLLAIIVVSSIMGGLQAYLVSRPQTEPWSAFEEPEATGVVEIQLTLTFDAGPDPFSLDATDAPSVAVQFQGKTVLQRAQDVPAGTLVRERVEGIVAGENEFFIQVTPKNSAEQVARAIRVQIFQDANLIVEKSLWSEPGDIVVGTIALTIDENQISPQHSH